MNTSNHNSMTLQSTTAMNTTTAMPNRNPAANAYWKSVKLCIARADGSTEIHHLDGRVERLSGDGRRARASEDSTDSTSVTLAA